VKRLNRRDIFDTVFVIEGPFTVIDVFKPYWIEAFVETLEGFPDVAPGHEECAGGLFHGAFLVQVAILIAVAAVHGIRRPQAIDAE